MSVPGGSLKITSTGEFGIPVPTRLDWFGRKSFGRILWADLGEAVVAVPGGADLELLGHYFPASGLLASITTNRAKQPPLPYPHRKTLCAFEDKGLSISGRFKFPAALGERWGLSSGGAVCYRQIGSFAVITQIESEPDAWSVIPERLAGIEFPYDDEGRNRRNAERTYREWVGSLRQKGDSSLAEELCVWPDTLLTKHLISFIKQQIRQPQTQQTPADPRRQAYSSQKTK